MGKRIVRGSWEKRLHAAGGTPLAGPAAALVLGLANLTLPPGASAQPAAAPARAASASVSASASAPAAPRASSSVRVIEDDQVRIEETRVRGQIQRITVAPKGSPGGTMRPYEINVGAGGRDPSQDKSGAGQRVWSVLRF